MAIGIIKRISPEYVLGKAFLDVKKKGLDGLKPYLTSKALKKIEVVQMVSTGMNLFSSPSKSEDDENAMVRLLISKMKECDWKVKKIKKNSKDEATCRIGFDYEDKLVGTVDLKMIKEKKEWRIDNLKMPHFDRVTIVNSK